MKRTILACQILVVALLVIKVFSYMGGMASTPLIDLFSDHALGQAIAQTTVTKPPAPPAKDVTEDHLQKERDLLGLLQKRQKELDAREMALKSEEQKVVALKREVMEKIDALKALDAQLSAKLEAEKSQDEKRFKELAKVYEAAPPQKAAAMLDKLTVKTAAGITINMKRDRAGLIWGFLTPQKAVDITNEITKSPRTSPD